MAVGPNSRFGWLPLHACPHLAHVSAANVFANAAVVQQVQYTIQMFTSLPQLNRSAAFIFMTLGLGPSGPPIIPSSEN